MQETELVLLRRQNRLLKLALIGGGIALALAAADPISDRLSTRRVEILDASGRVRAQLTVNDNGCPQLDMVDAKGARVTLGTWEGTSYLELKHVEGDREYETGLQADKDGTSLASIVGDSTSALTTSKSQSKLLIGTGDSEAKLEVIPTLSGLSLARPGRATAVIEGQDGSRVIFADTKAKTGHKLGVDKNGKFSGHVVGQ